MNVSGLVSLENAFRAAALAQFPVSILNLFLIRIMKWKPDLDRAPLPHSGSFSHPHDFHFYHPVDVRRLDLAVRA
jgi:hypothetical protein